MRNSKGFTLVEFIVVISVTVILGFIFSSILLQTLRGESKSKILNRVKQNGQVILERIASEIRGSEAVVCVNDDNINTDTIVTFTKGVYTRFRFYSPQPAALPTANGYITFDHPLTYSSLLCNEAQLTSEMNYLTDPNPISGISIDYDPLSTISAPTANSSIFTRSSLGGFGDVITIKFRTTAGVGAGKTYSEAVGSEGILFTTSVQARGSK